MGSEAAVDKAVFERARLSRDARFDGQFFVGVVTTGIYCRPICPANIPKSENVSFFKTAAAASEAGFRPCLRCRPECAPGTPAWSGTSTTVQRGLRLISDGALDDGDVERLAERLGVTSRHLRRLFTRHLGASPLAVAHTQRLQFAKRLIDDTSLPMKEVSAASGFGSVRRFNDTFRKTYGRTPRELRSTGGRSQAGDALSVRLAFRPPYDWRSLLMYFAARVTPGVEAVSAGRYMRTIDVDDSQGVMVVSEAGGHLKLELHGVGTRALFGVVQRVRAMFDLDAPPDSIRTTLQRDAFMRALLAGSPGLRVPGAWDGFELTVRAILGQQVSVRAATTLAGRVAARYGERLVMDARDVPGAPGRLFPGPERLVRARLESIGLIRARAQTIRDVARATLAGELVFDASQPMDELRAALMSIKGIGKWTAEYVLMRALKQPDAFPASDLGLLRAFDAENERRLSPAELEARSESWRPWRAYAAMLIWSADTGTGG
jgi:AraC family transcriptional regulator of adaptative response / DNA-3-methyladenine glycosylase II